MIKASSNIINHQGKSFKIDINEAVFRKGKTFYYFCDLDNQQQIIGDKDTLESILDPALFKTFVADQIVSQLVNSMAIKPNIMEFLIYILCGLGGGVCIGMIIGGFLP